MASEWESEQEIKTYLEVQDTVGNWLYVGYNPRIWGHITHL